MKKYLIILLLLCIIGLLFFLGHYSGVLIDFGREVYYPEQILSGKILYKDLFNIYGPLAYQINAVLYKLFGAKLSTLFGAGAICSLLTVSGIFLIARKFLSDFLSFCIGIFAIVTGITTVSIFNFHFPYSWAVLYGLVAFIYSLLFLLKFEETKNSKFLSISSLFAGICITCKYDFILYALVLVFFIFKNKNLKALITFCIAPVLSYGILFIQGMRFSDILNTLQIVSSMTHTKTLTYFYQNSGVYFTPMTIVWNITKFIIFAVPFGLFMLSANLFENKRIILKILSLFICASSLLIFWFTSTLELKTQIAFLPLFGILFAICLYKKFDFKLTILYISIFTISLKVIWALFLESYGTYYAPLLIIAILSLLFKFMPQKFEKYIGIYILFFSLIYFSFDCFSLNLSKTIIDTQKGKITTNIYQAESTNNLIEYINQNTNKNDKIVIFPEGMIINFLTDRKSDDFYNSLIPLYVETFGEEKIVEHFRAEKPDYIVVNNLNTKDYYYEYICQDYALEFCEFIKNNYKLQTVLDNNFRYIIFKKL